MEYCLLENVKYGNHERNVVDIAFPEGAAGNVDLVFMIHGGGWSTGDKETYRHEIEYLAKTGLVAASVNYRYVSETSDCYDILDDLTAALKVIKSEGEKRKIDIRKMLLTGLSAGGHLSLLYAYARGEEAPVKPAAVVTLSGPADMLSDEAVKKFVYENEMGDSTFILELLSKFLGIKLDAETYKTNKEALKAAKELSPLYYVNEKTVPTVICHAEHDKIVPFCNADDLDKALTKFGVEHDFIVFPESGHCLEKDPDRQKKTLEISNKYIEKYLSVFKK